jgi:hypothetical protein
VRVKLVTCENCTISFMVRIFRQYYSGNQIKQDEMGGTCSTNRIEEEILVGQPKIKRIFGKHKMG